MAEKKVIALQIKVDTSEVYANVEKTTATVDDLGKQTKKTSNEMKQGFKAAEVGSKGATKGVQGLSSSFGTMLKSLGLLAVAFQIFVFLKDLLMKNQRVADTFAKAFKVIEIVFGKVAGAVQDLVDGLRKLERFDIQAIKDEFLKFGSAVSDAGDGALALADKVIKLQNSVKLAEATQRLYTFTLLKEIESQRQIRDDISLTVAAREEANDRIEALLAKQLAREKGLSGQRLELALIEQEINNKSTDSQVEVINAKAEIADIEERINGFLSEQKTNREALRAEEDGLRQERIDGYEGAINFLREAEQFNTLEEQLGGVDTQIIDLQTTYIEALSGMREFLRDNNGELTADQIENHGSMIGLENAHQTKLNKLIKAKADIRKQYQIQSALEISSALGSIASSVESQGKAGLVASKVLAVAQIAIDTGVAIAGAIAQAQSVPFPGNIAAIATGVAAVIAGISSATQAINGANVAGASAPAPPSASAAIASSAPSFNPVTTNTTQLGNTEQAELAPIQAFVVETDVTNNQNNVNQIEGQASFGG
jgi:hypothetical protein